MNWLSAAGMISASMFRNDVTVRYNPALLVMDQFSKLVTIGGTLRIEKNSLLYSMTGLQNITEIGNDLILGIDSSVDSVPLTSLKSVGGNFEFHGHSRLDDVSGLSSLSSIGGDVIITSLESIGDLGFLSGISHVHGNLKLSYLGLKDFTGLENLVAVDGALTIAENGYALENLSGLNNLQYVGGGLTLGYNYALTSLQQLESLTSVGQLENGEDVRIVSNRVLPNCEICNLISRLSSVPDANETWIERNAGDTCAGETLTLEDLQCP
jgi:hypothetical protein